MYNQNNLKQQFFKYLVPSVSAMWFFSIYTMVDGMFVGRGVGPLALASVNLAMPFINAIFALALLVAVGSSTLITYYLGQNNIAKSNTLFTLNVLILTFLGLATTIITLLNLDAIAWFLGADADTFPYVVDYLKIIVSFSTFFMVAYSLEVLVKADGFPIYSILYVSLAAVINIVFDYIFVIHFDFGVKGAAYATGLSQFVSCLAFLTHFIWGRSHLKFIKIRVAFDDIKHIFITGFPEALTELSVGFTTFAFNTVILTYIGSNGVAAFGVLMYLNNLVLMSHVGVNQAMQPLVSYYNGIGNQLKKIALLKLASMSTMIFSIIFFISAQLFTRDIAMLFIDPSHVDTLELSIFALKRFSFSFLLCGINVIMSGYFTATKRPVQAGIVSALRGYVLITLALIAIPFFYGAQSIWLTPLAYELGTMAVGVLLLSRNRGAALDMA